MPLFPFISLQYEEKRSFWGLFISLNMLFSSSIHFSVNTIVSFIMTKLSLLLYIFHVHSFFGSQYRQYFKIFDAVHRHYARCPNLSAVICTTVLLVLHVCLECTVHCSCPPRLALIVFQPPLAPWSWMATHLKVNRWHKLDLMGF